MMNDNSKIANLLRQAADKVDEMPDEELAHTVTVTLDGNSPTNVSGKIEFDRDGEVLEHLEPVTFT